MGQISQAQNAFLEIALLSAGLLCATSHNDMLIYYTFNIDCTYCASSNQKTKILSLTTAVVVLCLSTTGIRPVGGT